MFGLSAEKEAQKIFGLSEPVKRLQNCSAYRPNRTHQPEETPYNPVLLQPVPPMSNKPTGFWAVAPPSIKPGRFRVGLETPGHLSDSLKFEYSGNPPSTPLPFPAVYMLVISGGWRPFFSTPYFIPWVCTPLTTPLRGPLIHSRGFVNLLFFSFC